jgi:geranylgeranyl transferase type-1 subunit beta
LDFKSNTTYPAGYAYCSIAALSFLDRSSAPASATNSDVGVGVGALAKGIPDREGLVNFLARRQFPYLASEEAEDEEDEENLVEAKLGELSISEDGRCEHVGFNGRINKKADTCYCWWVVGALSVRLPLHKTEKKKLEAPTLWSLFFTPMG